MCPQEAVTQCRAGVCQNSSSNGKNMGTLLLRLVTNYSCVIGGSSFSMNLDLMKCTTSILSMHSKAAIRACTDHLGFSPHFFSRYRTGWRLSSKICVYWLKPRRTAKSLHSCMCACVWAQACA